MGNAITNPGRFIEKKIMHERFGLPDSQANAARNARAEGCANTCMEFDQAVHGTPSSTDRRRIEKEMMSTFTYTHCVNGCLRSPNT